MYLNTTICSNKQIKQQLEVIKNQLIKSLQITNDSNIVCAASVSVWFQSKERQRNGIFGFGRARNETRAWLAQLVEQCSVWEPNNNTRLFVFPYLMFRKPIMHQSIERKPAYWWRIKLTDEVKMTSSFVLPATVSKGRIQVDLHATRRHKKSCISEYFLPPSPHVPFK